MLVLTRRSGETIILGDSIHVTVLEVRGSSVKLGLAAPLETPIRRGELAPTHGSPDGNIHYNEVERPKEGADHQTAAVGGPSRERRIPRTGPSFFQ
jgi:carbon storage regulator